MILSLQMPELLPVTPDLFRGPGATRIGLCILPWTPQQVRGDTVIGVIQYEIIPL